MINFAGVMNQMRAKPTLFEYEFTIEKNVLHMDLQLM